VAAKILIVDDSSLVTDAFEILFEGAGYKAHTARSVAEAVEIGKETPIDLMLLDLNLPDGSGLDVLHALRASKSLPRATVAMTGHNDAESRRKCLDAGCADVLVKPVPIRELLRKIEQLLA